MDTPPMAQDVRHCRCAPPLGSDVHRPCRLPASDRRAHQLFQTGLALHRAGRLAQSDSLMQATLRVSSDPMPLNILGKNSQARKDYKAAEALLQEGLPAQTLCPLPALPAHAPLRGGRARIRSPKRGRAHTRDAHQGRFPAEDDIRRRAREVIIDWEDRHPCPTCPPAEMMKTPENPD